MAEPLFPLPEGNVVDKLREAIFRILGEQHRQGPPTKEQESQWIYDNLGPEASMDHFKKGYEQRGQKAPTLQHGTVVGGPLGKSPFAAYWGRPAISGAGPFLGQAAGTVGMRAPAAAATNIGGTKILDTFVRQAPDALQQLPPDVLRRILVGAGATSLGASVGLLGSSLDAPGTAGAASPSSPPPSAPYATPRPFAEQKDEPEMIEPIASFPASTRKRKRR